MTLYLPSPRARFAVHSNSDNNLIRCLANRVLTYKGNSPIPFQRLRVADLNIFLGRFRNIWPTKKLSEAEFLSHYSGRKLTMYTNAFDDLRKCPLRSKDAQVGTFIKAEKFDWLSKGAEADPRAIQPRSYRYLASVGVYIKPMENVIYKDLTHRLGYKYACVAKGFNALECARVLRSKWEMFDDPVAMTLDASRFDLHVSPDMLRFTHKLYTRYNGSDELRKLLKLTLTNSGRATSSESAYKYTVDGRRMSGDMDTALGNCIIMVAMTWLLMRGVKHEVFDNGDDCLIICNRADLPCKQRVTEWYASFGFVIKVENLVSIFERIEFCQTHPVFRGDAWVMVRNIGAICKDMTCIGDDDFDKYTGWLKGVAMCGLSLTDGIPIFKAFYNMLSRLGTKSKIHKSVSWECGMYYMALGMHYVDRDIDSATRLSFELAFGIDPAMQVAIETYYASIMGPLDKHTLKWPIETHAVEREGDRWFIDNHPNLGGLTYD